jgi:predicted permease
LPKVALSAISDTRGAEDLGERGLLDIISITGVIFVLIGAGYGAVWSKVFSAAEMTTLGKFVVNLALPALIFQAVSSQPLGAIANPGYLSAVLLGSLATFFVGYGASRRLGGATRQASTFQAMGMSCANSGFIGYPVLLMALPAAASQALALNMIVENLVMIPLVLIMAEMTQGEAAGKAALIRQIAARLMRNPIVISLVLGILVSVSGLSLPVIAARPVQILANSSAALSLIAIGGTLAGLKLNSVTIWVVIVAAGKLVLHPLAVALGLGLMAAIGLGVGDADLAAAAVIMAAMPVMAIYPILAQRFGEDGTAALAMFVMTVLSFGTISIALAIVLP